MQQLRESNAEYFRRYLNSASGRRRRRRRRRRVTDVVSVTLILPVITFFRFEGARLLGERETERAREGGRAKVPRHFLGWRLLQKSLLRRSVFRDTRGCKPCVHLCAQRHVFACDGSYVIPPLRNAIGLARRIPTRCSSIMIALPVFSSSWRTRRIMPIFFFYLCIYICVCVCVCVCVQSIIRC